MEGKSMTTTAEETLPVHPRFGGAAKNYLMPRNGVLLPKYLPEEDVVTVTDVHLGDFHIWARMGGVAFVDVDGTVADLTHRRVYVATKPKNWPAFERAMHLDTPIQPVIDAIRALKEGGWTTVIMTGRGAQNKEVTQKWLADNGVPYDAIYTRAFKDYRRDDIVKAELLEQARADGFDPDVVFDDRNQVVEMWRRNGIPCIQVAEGDF